MMCNVGNECDIFCAAPTEPLADESVNRAMLTFISCVSRSTDGGGVMLEKESAKKEAAKKEVSLAATPAQSKTKARRQMWWDRRRKFIQAQMASRMHLDWRALLPSSQSPRSQSQSTTPSHVGAIVRNDGTDTTTDSTTSTTSNTRTDTDTDTDTDSNTSITFTNPNTNPNPNPNATPKALVIARNPPREYVLSSRQVRRLRQYRRQQELAEWIAHGIDRAERERDRWFVWDNQENRAFNANRSLVTEKPEPLEHATPVESCAKDAPPSSSPCGGGGGGGGCVDGGERDLEPAAKDGEAAHGLGEQEEGLVDAQEEQMVPDWIGNGGCDGDSAELANAPVRTQGDLGEIAKRSIALMDERDWWCLMQDVERVRLWNQEMGTVSVAHLFAGSCIGLQPVQ